MRLARVVRSNHMNDDGQAFSSIHFHVSFSFVAAAQHDYDYAEPFHFLIMLIMDCFSPAEYQNRIELFQLNQLENGKLKCLLEETSMTNDLIEYARVYLGRGGWGVGGIGRVASPRAKLNSLGHQHGVSNYEYQHMHHTKNNTYRVHLCLSYLGLSVNAFIHV